MESTFELIRKLVETTAITNKWLMWSESELPEQSVYVPSIFQMRDAFSHLITMYGEGISKYETSVNLDLAKGFIDFYSDPEAIHQLTEAFSHVSRAFFDCADNILISVKDDIDNSDDSAFWKNIYLNNFVERIIELRKAKSDGLNARYDNIVKWDKCLQIITTIYNILDLDEQMQSKFHLLNQLISRIEKNHNKDIIVSYCSDFYSRIKMEKEKLLLNLNVYEKLGDTFHNLSDLDNIIVGDILGWQNEVRNILEERARKIDLFINELILLDKAMVSSTNIEKEKKAGERAYTYIEHVVKGVLAIIISVFLGDSILQPIAVKVSTNVNNSTQPNQVLASFGESYGYIITYSLTLITLIVIIHYIFLVIKRLLIKYRPRN